MTLMCRYADAIRRAAGRVEFFIEYNKVVDRAAGDGGLPYVLGALCLIAFVALPAMIFLTALMIPVRVAGRLEDVCHRPSIGGRGA